MKKNFVLSCESTLDLPESYTKKREMHIIFYSYVIDGVEYEDNMGRSKEALEHFYTSIYSGKLPTTSLIVEHRYEEYFERLINETDLPILHLAFSSGLTPSAHKAVAAADTIRQKYPNARLEVVDSLCGGTGLGLLAEYVADLRDEGKTIDEALSWLNENKLCIRHLFFSTDMKFFRRSGRVSGAGAMIASVLGICPTMRVDREGKIFVYDKVKGKRRVMRHLARDMEECCDKGIDYDETCYVSHSDCREDAELMKKTLLEHFPQLSDENVPIVDIGTTMASHCGPGTVAIFFKGTPRTYKIDDE